MTSEDLDPEDTKIVILARATRARAGGAEGAAVRDTTGRTYTAASVRLPSLQLTALQLAVAMACSSGAEGLEAAAVSSGGTTLADADVAVVREAGGAGVTVYLADAGGDVIGTRTT